MAFRQSFFFDTPEATKIVLPNVPQNFKKTPNCTRWPKEVNQKGFPRNILVQPQFQNFKTEVRIVQTVQSFQFKRCLSSHEYAKMA